MLAPPTDFGYSPSHGYQQQQQQQQAQHSDERPKLFAMEHGHNGAMPGMTMMGVHEYHHQMVHHGTPHHHHMTPQHAMTPQHTMTPQHAMTPQHHQVGEYEHEPLVMGVAPATHYYAPMGAHMLLVSSDYDYNSGNSVDGATPKSGKGGSKRSREDLNLKEKKRMFKLNDRITQLKDMLEDAGVQTKKNKQSVLDNATFFIEQLRSDLMIAKQKAERAEKEAEHLKAQANKSTKGDSNSVFKGCFQQSVTPRVVVDLNMKPITINSAFQKHSGRDSKYLMKKDNLLAYLSKDTSKLEPIAKKVREQNKPTTVTVEAATTKGVVTVLLMASPVCDDQGKASQIEISLIPVEVESKPILATETKQPAAAKAEPKAEAGESIVL